MRAYARSLATRYCAVHSQCLVDHLERVRGQVPASGEAAKLRKIGLTPCDQAHRPGLALLALLALLVAVIAAYMRLFRVGHFARDPPPGMRLPVDLMIDYVRVSLPRMAG